MARWPRLMGKEVAAEYCGVSPGHFLAHCPVQAVRMGSRVLWDRHALDQWLDSLSGLAEPDTEASEWLRRLDDAYAVKGRPPGHI